MRAAFFIFALGLSLLLFIPYASAAETEACQFSSKIAELNAVQFDPSLDYFESVRREAELRRELLRKVIDCGAEEIRELQTTLRALPEDKGTDRLRSQLLEGLNEALPYYELQRKKIDDLTIRESRDLARILREWREAHYAPIVERIVNFVLWTKNQDLFRTAQKRFDHISQTVNNLKLTQTEEIRMRFEKAEGSLSEASELNRKVKRALEQPDPHNDALTLLKNSLETLSATYQDFLNLGEAVKKILPYD
jgi:hypothetical protein